MNCTECSLNVAEFICLCRWPLDHFFCKADISTHVAELNTGFSHRQMPIIHLKTLTSKEEFDLLLLRWERFDTVKTVLSERVERANGWRDPLPQQASEELQTLRASNMLKLEAYCQSLAGQVSSAMQEITLVLEDPNHEIQGTLGISCWEFICERTASFEPRFTLEGDLESFQAELEYATRETEVTTHRERQLKAEEEAKQQRQAIRAAKWNKCKFCCMKTYLYLRKQVCWPLMKTGRFQYPTPCQMLCFIPMLHWGVVGLCQSMEYVKTNDHECDSRAVFMCLLPSLCFCFGAAYNRSWLRGGYDRECLRDLFLFSLHIWNACLVDVEVASIELPKAICCCFYKTMKVTVEASLEAQRRQLHPS